MARTASAIAPSIVHDALASGGRPLDRATRGAMESRFGHDFDGVRVHTDGRAARAAHAIDSEAYTVGTDVAFAAGRYRPDSVEGRRLLAHELAHVVQQSAASGGLRGAKLSKPGDSHERAADAAAAAVLAGKRVSAQPTADSPIVARQAATPKPGFVINVVVEKPIKGHEFCVRAVMQGHQIDRDQAESLLGAGRLHCYGWAAERGVPLEWVGHPIRFRIREDLFAPGGQPAAGSALTPEPGERDDVNAETDRRFWERIGDIRNVSSDRPEDEAYREVWMAERERVLFERHDPFGPALRRFAAIGNLPAARAADDIPPWDLDAMLEVKAMLAQLTPRGWIRLQRIGLPQTSWEGLAEWLPKFIAQQRADEGVIERVRAFDKLGGLDSAYGTIHGEGRGSRDPAAPEAFERRNELEQAAEDFKAMFRTRAVEKAIETFRGVHAAMDAASKRPRLSRGENDKLYAVLQAATGPDDVPEEVLRRSPVLRDPVTFRVARNTMYASDLGSYLAQRAVKWAADSQYLAEHVAEKPDVVFKFDAIVDATLKELGLDASVHARIIHDWGKPDDSGLFSLLLQLGLLVMMFVPGLDIVAAGIFAAEAGTGFYSEVRDYSKELKRWNRGERADAPSPWGVLGAGANLGLSAVPFAHGFGAARGVTAGEGLLEESGRIEGLAAEARTGGTLEGETAAARSGTEVTVPAEARVGVDVTEAAGAGAGRAPAAPIEPRPLDAPTLAASHVETPPAPPSPDLSPVTAEPPVGSPAPDVETPSAPVTTEPAVGTMAAKAPPVAAPDPMVRAEERFANAKARAEAARARLAAVSENVTTAKEAAKVADAELAQARQEAKAARAAKKRAERAYGRAKSTKDAPRAGPRANYTAAKDAAEQAERKLANASKRAKTAKEARGEAARAVPHQETIVGRAEQAVGEAEQQRLIEAEADRLRRLPRNVEGLPPSWDYERFPKGPRRDWQPGDPINMPDANGIPPVYKTTGRSRVWRTLATDELAERRAERRVRATIPPRPKGPVDPHVWQEVPKGGLQWLDPIREATDEELWAIASSGSMPSHLGAEIEHARIPQRVQGMLKRVGVDPNTARRVAKVADPSNLIPTRKEIHAILDERAHEWPSRNPTLPVSLDVRATAPFREATDEEISDIVKAIKNRRIAVRVTEARKQALELETLRGFLAAEKKLRPSATWEVP